MLGIFIKIFFHTYSISHIFHEEMLVLQVPALHLVLTYIFCKYIYIYDIIRKCFMLCKLNVFEDLHLQFPNLSYDHKKCFVKKKNVGENAMLKKERINCFK